MEISNELFYALIKEDVIEIKQFNKSNGNYFLTLKPIDDCYYEYLDQKFKTFDEALSFAIHKLVEFKQSSFTYETTHLLKKSIQNSEL